MAELGLIAAVVQVADVGFRLGDKLYTFGQTVSSADESIVFISKDISHTCSILKELQHSLDKDHGKNLYSSNAINTARTIVEECQDIFQRMDQALSKKITRMGLDSNSSRAAIVLERLKWPLLKPKIMILWGHLGTLKSSLQLTLNVFIYARSLVESPEESSAVNDLRATIEDLLRKTAEQSCKYDSLKAALDGNKNLGAAGKSDNGDEPVAPGLNTAMMPIETSDDNKSGIVAEAPEVDTAMTPVENYCLLIQGLISEIEAKGYRIGHDVQCQIRDDVINTHNRETRLLCAAYGNKELKGKMAETAWRSGEIAGEEGKGVERSQSPSGPVFGHFDGSGPSHPDANTGQSSQGNTIRKPVRHYEGPVKGDLARAPAFSSYPRPILVFLKSHPTNDPWTTENMRSSPFGVHKVYSQNKHMPPLPVKKSGTSMLVSQGSAEKIVSSQDLAALTDSSGTETFVSAESVFGELAVDSEPLLAVDRDKQEARVVVDDQEGSGPIEKGFARVEIADSESFLSELPMAWTNST